MSSTSSISASGKITGVQVRIVAVVVLGAFLALLNQTVMSPALPVIMADFGIDASTAQWIMSIYPLVSGISTPDPAACSTRPTISSEKSGATAHSSVPAANATSAPKNSLRVENLSIK